MWTFNQLWGVKTPAEAKAKIKEQTELVKNPKNLEEWALSQVGSDIYNRLIYGYTKKQWQCEPSLLPSAIIKRLPLRFTYDNDYYNDRYSGIPIGGYTKIIEALLEGIEIKLQSDFFKDREEFEKISKKIVYTGKIDEFFNYKFGELEYRTLKFEHETLNVENFQGVAGVNYTDFEVPFTRIVEHKHFESVKTEKTVITREYPDDWNRQKIPYYPLNNEKNNLLYKRYKSLLSKNKKYIFGGRLAEYKYYDMDQVIASALSKFKRANQ